MAVLRFSAWRLGSKGFQSPGGWKPNIEQVQVRFDSGSMEEKQIISSILEDILCNAYSTTFESIGSARIDDESGAYQFFGTLTREELEALLGAENSSSHREGNVVIYQCPSPTTVTFPREDIVSNWVYLTEDENLALVPFKSTRWITNWLL